MICAISVILSARTVSLSRILIHNTVQIPVKRIIAACGIGRCRAEIDIGVLTVGHIDIYGEDSCVFKQSHHLARGVWTIRPGNSVTLAILDKDMAVSFLGRESFFGKVTRLVSLTARIRLTRLSHKLARIHTICCLDQEIAVKGFERFLTP